MFKSWRDDRHLSGLVEIDDARGRPVCLIPASAAREQGLVFRKVVLQVMTCEGSLLLSENPEGQFEPTFMDPLPAGISPHEFAVEMQARCPGLKAGPRQIPGLEPERIHIFCAICSEAFLKAIAAPPWLASTRPEIARLAQYGLIAPLLARILPLLPEGHSRSGPL